MHLTTADAADETAKHSCTTTAVLLRHSSQAHTLQLYAAKLLPLLHASINLSTSTRTTMRMHKATAHDHKKQLAYHDNAL
jgi:hypothetical protein